jgi:hypothetical protein
MFEALPPPGTDNVGLSSYDSIGVCADMSLSGENMSAALDKIAIERRAPRVRSFVIGRVGTFLCIIPY